MTGQKAKNREAKRRDKKEASRARRKEKRKMGL